MGFWVFWVVDIFTSSLGERAMMLVEMLFVGRRGDEFARFSHEAGEIPSEPWQFCGSHVRLLNLVGKSTNHTTKSVNHLF